LVIGQLSVANGAPPQATTDNEQRTTNKPMNKIPKDKQQKIIAVGLMTIMVSALIWFGFISSQTKTLTTVRQQKATASLQLQKGQATLASAESLTKAFDDVSRKLKEREAGMAAPNDMFSWLVQTLNTFRAPYNVDIPQFGRELPTEVGVFAKFPYRAALFTVKGSAYYHDFGKFLADFENTFPNIRVQNIELDPATDSAGGANSGEKLSFKMDLLTLVRPIAL